MAEWINEIEYSEFYKKIVECSHFWLKSDKHNWCITCRSKWISTCTLNVNLKIFTKMKHVSNLQSIILDCGAAAFANFWNGLPFFPEDVSGTSFQNVCHEVTRCPRTLQLISPPWNFEIPKGVCSQTESILF